MIPVNKNIDINWEYAGVYENFYRDFKQCRHRRYSLYGGRNSAKSTAAYQLVIETVMTEGNVICTRRHYNTIGGSSYNHIKKLIHKAGLEDLFKFKESPYLITYKPNGYRIIFKGLDDPEKVKSTVAPIGDIVLVLFEEAQEIPNMNIPEEAISTFERGEGDDKFRALFLFNPPPNKNHFTNQELRKSSDDDHLLALYVSYKNLPPEWVGTNARKEIDRLLKYNYKLYLYRYMGEPITSEDVIFENIRIQKITDEQIDKWLADDEYLYCGLDFGYNPDPNAACMMKYDPDERILYIFKEFHAGKLNNKQISEGLEQAGFTREYKITCDNDEKTINDLRTFNWYVRSAIKGPGSKDAGFKWLQGLSEIVIDNSRCPNTATEFTEYHYTYDKFGELRGEYPEGQEDHHIAAVRYAMEEIWRKAGM